MSKTTQKHRASLINPRASNTTRLEAAAAPSLPKSPGCWSCTPAGGPVPPKENRDIRTHNGALIVAPV